MAQIYFATEFTSHTFDGRSILTLTEANGHVSVISLFGASVADLKGLAGTVVGFSVTSAFGKDRVNVLGTSGVTKAQVVGYIKQTHITPNPLWDGAVSRWLLQTADATELDSIGSDDLTEVGSPVVNAGGGPGSQDVAQFPILGDYYTGATQTKIANYYTTGFSVSFWAKVNASISNQAFIEHAGYFKISRISFKTRAYIYDSTTNRLVSGLANMLITQWYHVVLTSDSAETELWIDGVSQGTSTTSLPAPIVTAQQLTIGTGAAGAAPSRSDITDMTIWDRVLTDAEIAELFSGQGLIA